MVQPKNSQHHQPALNPKYQSYSIKMGQPWLQCLGCFWLIHKVLTNQSPEVHIALKRGSFPPKTWRLQCSDIVTLSICHHQCDKFCRQLSLNKFRWFHSTRCAAVGPVWLGCACAIITMFCYTILMQFFFFLHMEFGAGNDVTFALTTFHLTRAEKAKWMSPMLWLCCWLIPDD